MDRQAEEIVAFASGIAAVAPGAELIHVRRRPIAGAALLALAHAGAPEPAIARADRALGTTPAGV